MPNPMVETDMKTDHADYNTGVLKLVSLYCSQVTPRPKEHRRWSANEWSPARGESQKCNFSLVQPALVRRDQDWAT